MLAVFIIKNKVELTCTLWYISTAEFKRQVKSMTLQQLHYLIVICECGSLNKAAEILYVSQPSLSGCLREVERELGITIFNRSSKGVTLTNDGMQFLLYARQIYSQYEEMLEHYSPDSFVKKKFGVSTQHYSFAVKAFVETVNSFDLKEYEFAIRETKTADVINDVATMRSEIGILYLNEFNGKSIKKLLSNNSLEFHHLIDCKAFVYLWKGHPLANNSVITFEELQDYPCLSFEQGEGASFYLAEEMLSTKDYQRVIRANDRATMLNLMVGLNGYTLCSGIICEELNGGDYKAVPFDMGNTDESAMEIGYIMKKNVIPSRIANIYINEMKKYLGVD